MCTDRRKVAFTNESNFCSTGYMDIGIENKYPLKPNTLIYVWKLVVGILQFENSFVAFFGCMNHCE